MIIWIDARDIFWDSSRNNFIKSFIKIAEKDSTNNYVIFLSNWEKIDTSLKIIRIKYNKNLFENIAFWRYLSKINIDKIISFDHFWPLFSNKRIISFPFFLDDLFFPQKTGIIERKKSLFLSKIYYYKVSKVICFTPSQKSFLSLRFALPTNKISIIKPNLFSYKKLDWKQDIRLKHNIVWDYILVSWKNKTYENSSRILKAFFESNREDLSLIFLWSEYEKDVNLKNLVIKYWLWARIFFVSYMKKEELYPYFSQSLASIFYSSYEDFPFEMSKSVSFWTKILSSKSPFIEKSFSKIPWFFSKNSVSDLSSKIKNIEKTAKVAVFDTNNDFDKQIIEVISSN